MTSRLIKTPQALFTQRPASHGLSALVAGATSLLLSLSVSFAQTEDSVTDSLTTISLSPADEALNIESCETIAEETEFTLSGEYSQPSLTIGYTVRLIATTGSSCSHEDVCNTVPLDEGGCSCLREVSTGSVSTRFKVSDLFDEPCVEGEERVVSFFLQYTEEDVDPLLGTSPIEEESSAVKLNIDLKAPSAPTEAPSVSPAEEALQVTVSEVGGDASDYSVCVRQLGDTAEFSRCKSVTPGERLRFDGLENDVTYEVIYRAFDEAGNESEQSPASQGTPASVLDFAEIYSQQYPGGELGGCESRPAPLGFGGLLLMVCALGLRRRRAGRSMLGVALCVMTLTTVPVAELSAEPWVTTGSDRTTTVTFHAGSYLPAIDTEFAERPNTPRPYELIFQNDAPLMFLVQADRHLIQRYGTLSVGGSVGYWNVEGEALSQDAEVTESTEMSMYPLAVLLNYRFDVYQSVIPLVPVVKLGLHYYLWTVYDGAGEAARFVDGSEASGGTLGFSYTLGVHFLLDALDREMAWAFDRDAGVNHSYLSLEYQSSQVDDFGSTTSFRLGSDVFLVGLSLDI